MQPTQCCDFAQREDPVDKKVVSFADTSNDLDPFVVLPGFALCASWSKLLRMTKTVSAVFVSATALCNFAGAFAG